MTTTELSDRLRLTTSPGLIAEPAASDPGRSPGLEVAVDALCSTEATVVGHVRVRRAPGEPDAIAQLELDSASPTGCALLMECDGALSWHFPRRDASDSERSSSSFELDLYDVESSATLVVLDLGPAAGPIERLVVPTIDPPEFWAPIDPPLATNGSADAPRFLVLLHDVAATSASSFGTLSSTSAGQAFLDAAARGYDAVVAYDHDTIARSPQDNAADLLGRLRTASNAAPTIDLVAIGRGALVARCFAELELPASDWPAQIGRVAYIAAANAGTPLARVEEQARLLDIITGLALAEAQVELDDGAAGAQSRARAHIADLVTLVRAVATGSSSPGLAAMAPGSATIERLRADAKTATAPHETYAVTSMLRAGRGEVAGLDAAPLRWLASRLEGSGLHADNDLIVDTGSMAALDRGHGEVIVTRLELTSADAPHHLAYLRDGRVIEAIGRWLRLELQTVDAIDFAAPQPAASAEFQFRAELPGQARVGNSVSLRVQVSRDALETALGSAAARDAAVLDLDQPLDVLVIGRQNLEVEGDARVAIDPPAPGAPVELYFDLRATELGTGEAWVVFRQKLVARATLRLRTAIVDTITGERQPEASEAILTSPPRAQSDELFSIDVTERRTGAGLSLVYVVSCRALAIDLVCESKPIEGDIQSYVNGVYKQILDRYQASHDDPESFMLDLQGYGGDLLDQLLPVALQQALWDNRARIEGILLTSEQPHIPWELLHLKEPGKKIRPGEPCFLGQLGLTRWIADSSPPAQLRVRWRQAHYVIPDYPDKGRGRPPQLPEAKEEIPFLSASFGADAVRPRTKDVRSLLMTPGAFDLLHFACHGEAETDDIGNARLLMEGRVAGGMYVRDTLSSTTVEQFAQLQDDEGHGPVVVLNACQTGRSGRQLSGQGGFAHAFLKGGASAFVGALWNVGDASARTFMETLYERMRQGDPAWKAVIAARAQAREKGDHTWIAYIVYANPHARLVLEGAPAEVAAEDAPTAAAPAVAGVDETIAAAPSESIEAASSASAPAVMRGGSDPDADELVFNGIDGRSGGYLLSPMTADSLGRMVAGEPIEDADSIAELKQRVEADVAHYGVKEGIDPRDLSQAGWGVLFPYVKEGSDAFTRQQEIRARLQPLLDLRREQSTKNHEHYFKDYSGALAYRPDEGKQKWLARNGAGPGPADPNKVPYYLLLVASPEEIPYKVQYQLDVQYAVGRVDFDDLASYAHYAASVVAAETRAQLPRRAAFFATANADDASTQASARHLVAPLSSYFEADQRDNGWSVDRFVADAASKSRLSSLLCDEPPALLFAASHGMGFPSGDPLQLAHQGALLCQDWPGPQRWRQEIPQDHYFAADELGDDTNLLGMIAFLFACYGASTPRHDEFAIRITNGGGAQREEIAPRPFTAMLPQRMLGLGRGGALAVVGHVERAWGDSFLWSGTRDADGSPAQRAVFESTIKRLAEGYPVGAAMEYFNQRYAEIASDLTVRLEDIEFGAKYQPTELAKLWTANNDARGYAVIGDPAVRCAIAPSDVEVVADRPSIALRSPSSTPPSVATPALTGQPLSDISYEAPEATAATSSRPPVDALTTDLAATLRRAIAGMTDVEVTTRSAAGAQITSRIGVDGEIRTELDDGGGDASKLVEAHAAMTRVALEDRRELLATCQQILAKLNNVDERSTGS